MFQEMSSIWPRVRNVGVVFRTKDASFRLTLKGEEQGARSLKHVDGLGLILLVASDSAE